MTAGPPPSAPEHVTLTPPDGQRVAATLFPAHGAVQGRILVAGATVEGVHAVGHARDG
jgi:predicted alpha/beta hydrolase